MTTIRFGWTWMLAGCVAVAGAAGAKTFRIQDSVLLFGNYNEVRIVTADEERLVHPPLDVKYNGGYFAFPSLAPRGDFVAWGSRPNRRWRGRTFESGSRWESIRSRSSAGRRTETSRRSAMPPSLRTVRRSLSSPANEKRRGSRFSPSRGRHSPKPHLLAVCPSTVT